MVNKNIGKGILFLILTVLILIIVYNKIIIQTSIYTDENEQEILYNPLIGYAVSADYPDAVGENTLVYIGMTWSDIEPQDGVYDFTTLINENQAQEYASQGKHAVFRLLCDVPGQEEHMDIPQWLYEKTRDGTFYDTSYGKGYSPNYANPDLIEAHGKVLQKIAEAFEEVRPGFLSYVQLGSLGHWGEWHVKSGEGIVPIPEEAVCMQYVDQYVEAFPDVQLMMRRPFLGVKEYDLGVYNDMTGEAEDTNEWLEWLNDGGVYTEPAKAHTLYAIPDFYKKAAVGGEFTSARSWEELLVTDMDTTKSLIRQSHMSFIGPKVPHALEAPQYQQEAAVIRELLGYKLGISKAAVKRNRLSGIWDIAVTWNNQGIAPMYEDWAVYLYFYDEENNFIEKQQLDMNLSDIMPDMNLKVQWSGQLPDDVAKIRVAIEDPMTGDAAVTLNNAGQDKYVTIYSSNY